MDPTLKVGDVLLVNKWAYLRRPPQRGDLVVVRWGRDEAVKRVIGLEGDVVEERDHNLYLNGRLQPAPFWGPLPYPNQSCMPEPFSRAVYEERVDGALPHLVARTHRSVMEGRWIVPAGEFFLLGDNRDESQDSRHPMTPRGARRAKHFYLKDVVGRVEHVVYSVDPCP